MLAHRVAKSDIGLVAIKVRKLPWDAAGLGIERDGNTPHRLSTAGTRKDCFVHDLHGNAKWRDQRFKPVVEIKSLVREGIFPLRWKIDHEHIERATFSTR